jgi:nicotinamidase-related amidase
VVPGLLTEGSSDRQALRGRALSETRPPSAWSGHALLLVDLQRDFWTEETEAAAPDLPERVAGLLAFARAEELLVVHLRARFQSDGSDWMARYRLRGQIPCVDGTPGVETLPFGLERPGEPVVTKRSFDGFLGTGLDELLQQRGVRHVLVAGLVTSTCVLFTAATATQRGYLVSVVSDCCSDRGDVHELTLATYPFVFGSVLSTDVAARRDWWNRQVVRMQTLPAEA